ncbi:MAG: DUF484 family protein [Blastochloris viridis]|uniref:DUF484 family protein n=1 Tax=Blastochloris viridis TaxID=1079 RepID=A0A6N4RCH3_BLAVI|nr:MAG: DUF484 family protein [Blastochloris viridis]
MTAAPAKTAKTIKKTATKSKPALKPAQVLSYLQNNPKFFETHREQLTEQFASGNTVPKKGRMGAGIISLHAAKAERVSRDAENLKVRHQQLISTARGNAEIAESIFTAVLGLIPCRTLADLRKYLQNSLSEQLDVEAIRLFKVGPEETATTLTADQINGLCPQDITTGPMDAAKHRILFGPKTSNIKSVCLMALSTDDDTLHGLLALGSTDATRFHAGQAVTLANFLRRATAGVLAHAS